MLLLRAYARGPGQTVWRLDASAAAVSSFFLHNGAFGCRGIVNNSFLLLFVAVVVFSLVGCCNSVDLGFK